MTPGWYIAVGAVSVYQNQRRCRAGAVQVEVFFADWHRNILQCRIEMLPDAFDVRQLIFRLRIFSLEPRNRRVEWVPAGSSRAVRITDLN